MAKKFSRIEIRAEMVNMTNFIRIAAVLAISAFCCRGSQGDELSSQALEASGLQVRWTAQAVLNTSRDSLRHVTNDEELLYLQSSAGIITALNSESGRRVWSIQLGRNDEPAMEAVSNKDTLLVVVGPVVYGLNKFSGEQLFAYRLPAQPNAGPAMYEYEYSGQPGVFDYGFLIPLVDGSVVAYQIDRLSFQQRYGKLPLNAASPLSWRYFCGENIRFPPLAGTETIAIGTDSGNIHAVNTSGLNTGRLLYQLFLKSPISAPLTFSSRDSTEVVYVATADNRLFCFALTKGANMMWTFPMGHAITEPLVAVGEDVYVTTVGGSLTAMSAEIGIPQNAKLELLQVLAVPGFGLPVAIPMTITWPWDIPSIRYVAAVSGNRVYAVDNAQRLAIIDRHTSSVLKRIPVRGYSHPLRNLLTDRIYLISDSGHIVCLAETGSDFPVSIDGRDFDSRGLMTVWNRFPVLSVTRSHSEFATYHQNPQRKPVMPDVPATEKTSPPAENGDLTP